MRNLLAVFALLTMLVACTTTTTATAPAAASVATVWSERYQCRSVAPDEEAAACTNDSGRTFGAESTCQGTEDGFDNERARLDACAVTKSCPCACMRVVKCQ